MFVSAFVSVCVFPIICVSVFGRSQFKYHSIICIISVFQIVWLELCLSSQRNVDKPFFHSKHSALKVLQINTYLRCFMFAFFY